MSSRKTERIGCEFVPKPVINELAKEYGGGGHPLASGARLEDAGGILEFVEKLDDVAAKYTEEK